ncbi:unknown [Clostridium sp. CAG:1024]|nr:unknown [Clostridium sp. CAG:1024]
MNQRRAGIVKAQDLVIGEPDLGAVQHPVVAHADAVADRAGEYDRPAPVILRHDEPDVRAGAVDHAVLKQPVQRKDQRAFGARAVGKNAVETNAGLLLRGKTDRSKPPSLDSVHLVPSRERNNGANAVDLARRLRLEHRKQKPIQPLGNAVRIGQDPKPHGPFRTVEIIGIVCQRIGRVLRVLLAPAHGGGDRLAAVARAVVAAHNVSVEQQKVVLHRVNGCGNGLVRRLIALVDLILRRIVEIKGLGGVDAGQRKALCRHGLRFQRFRRVIAAELAAHNAVQIRSHADAVDHAEPVLAGQRKDHIACVAGRAVAPVFQRQKRRPGRLIAAHDGHAVAAAENAELAVRQGNEPVPGLRDQRAAGEHGGKAAVFALHGDLDPAYVSRGQLDADHILAALCGRGRMRGRRKQQNERRKQENEQRFSHGFPTFDIFPHCSTVE